MCAGVWKRGGGSRCFYAWAAAWLGRRHRHAAAYAPPLTARHPAPVLSRPPSAVTLGPAHGAVPPATHHLAPLVKGCKTQRLPRSHPGQSVDGHRGTSTTGCTSHSSAFSSQADRTEKTSRR